MNCEDCPFKGESATCHHFEDCLLDAVELDVE